MEGRPDPSLAGFFIFEQLQFVVFLRDISIVSTSPPTRPVERCETDTSIIHGFSNSWTKKEGIIASIMCHFQRKQ